MPQFHLHKLKLSKAQMRKLAKGERVKLAYSDLHGSVPVHLTKRQLNKIQKSLSDHKGMMLQFSEKQAKHNVKRGGDFWGDLWGGIKGVASDVYNQALKPMITPQNAMALAKMAAGVKKTKKSKKGGSPVLNGYGEEEYKYPNRKLLNLMPVFKALGIKLPGYGKSK